MRVLEEESFKGIIKGTMTVQDAFRNLCSMRIADHFLDMAAQMAQIKSGIMGLFRVCLVIQVMVLEVLRNVFAGFERGPTDPSTLQGE